MSNMLQIIIIKCPHCGTMPGSFTFKVRLLYNSFSSSSYHFNSVMRQRLPRVKLV